MNAKAFIDTNVFVYLYSEDEEWKQKRVYDAIETHDCITSIQVINEFSNVCLKKLKMPSSTVKAAIDEITEGFIVVPIGTDDIKQALTIHENYGYSYYDSLILASALSSGCEYLLSEDMSHDQVIYNQTL
ncbi:MULTISPECIES: PIN domain-containing protein [Proteiniphilum]|uniref:PIN domain-containing protein n=1 Tax=Proteiniphilum TaxID=294702 RepID=UPI00037DF31C|nr:MULTISPECIES: PIN domain-containing protein [Proteiniphilum]